MTIHLSKELEQFIQDAVRAGLYAREDDVIRDALIRLQQTIPQPPAAGAGETTITDRESADQEIQRRLFDAGLLSEIKPPIRDLTPYRDRKPVPIKGESLSETVLRERR